jgi:hypothetical protein
MPETLHVSSSSMGEMVTMAVMARSSSSGPRGTEPLPKKAHFEALLWVSSRYACHPYTIFCSSYLCS